jgi:adenylate kinase
MKALSNSMASKASNTIAVFLGAPGAGKGTQAASVAKVLNLQHISSGDMFRRAVERADNLGRTVRTYMEKGALVPDEITTRMVLDELKASGRGIILDGFPRNLKQAMILDEALQQEQRAVDRVVYIKVSEAELLRRLSSRWLCRRCQAPYTQADKVLPAVCAKCSGELYQRPDDQPETVRKRLTVYFTETAPLIAYYRKQNKLDEVDGQGEVTTISKRIISALTD